MKIVHCQKFYQGESLSLFLSRNQAVNGATSHPTLITLSYQNFASVEILWKGYFYLKCSSKNHEVGSTGMNSHTALPHLTVITSILHVKLYSKCYSVSILTDNLYGCEIQPLSFSEVCAWIKTIEMRCSRKIGIYI